MFSNSFSFDGRISRKEYIYSYIIAVVANVIIAAIDIPVILLLSYGVLFFILAQGAKRCHDYGRSGWWQLIPFYFIWMFFQKGDDQENEYGVCPQD